MKNKKSDGKTLVLENGFWKPESKTSRKKEGSFHLRVEKPLLEILRQEAEKRDVPISCIVRDVLNQNFGGFNNG